MSFTGRKGVPSKILFRNIWDITPTSLTPLKMAALKILRLMYNESLADSFSGLHIMQSSPPCPGKLLIFLFGGGICL